MTSSSESGFKKSYQAHLQHLRLKGLQPKTIEVYSRATLQIKGNVSFFLLFDINVVRQGRCWPGFRAGTK